MSKSFHFEAGRASIGRIVAMIALLGLGLLGLFVSSCGGIWLLMTAGQGGMLEVTLPFVLGGLVAALLFGWLLGVIGWRIEIRHQSSERPDE